MGFNKKYIGIGFLAAFLMAGMNGCKTVEMPKKPKPKVDIKEEIIESYQTLMNIQSEHLNYLKDKYGFNQIGNGYDSLFNTEYRYLDSLITEYEK